MPNLGGPILFGFCLDILLFGILTVQTYLYYLAFPRDRRATKAIVSFVYIIGTVQVAFALHDFYSLFCTPQGHDYLENPTLNINRFGFMCFTIPVDSATVAFVVQLFYAHRIYVISKSRAITVIVSLLAIFPFIGGILSAVWSFGSFQGVSASTTDTILIAATASGIGCDLLIAAYMSYYLSKQMRGASKTTQVLVTKIVRLLLETGILTAGVSVACTILVFTGTTPYEYMIPTLGLGKLYANSMLVLLNNRFAIPGGRNTLHPDFDIPSYRPSNFPDIHTGPVISHSIAFMHNHGTGTTFSRSEAPDMTLETQQEHRLQELGQMGNLKVETAHVV